METKIVLESAKGVANGKVQLCFSQIVQTATSSPNVLGILNASDDRFNQQKPRYAWVTVQPEDASREFGIDFTGLAQGQELEIGKVNPEMKSLPGKELAICITETTEGSEYDVANFETRAKRAGKDGDFIMKDGKYIYVRTSVVPVEPGQSATHKIFTDTTRLEAGSSASSAIADALGN